LCCILHHHRGRFYLPLGHVTITSTPHIFDHGCHAINSHKGREWHEAQGR
jgi:hypothetical protein